MLLLRIIFNLLYMNTTEAISQIMTPSPITVTIKNTLVEAIDLIKKNKIRHIPVVDENKNLVGILSLTDIERISIGGAFGGDPEFVNSAIFEMLTIEQVMKKNPHRIQKDKHINELAQILMGEEYHALPVMEGDKLVGMVTTTDVIRFLLEKCESPTLSLP